MTGPTAGSPIDRSPVPLDRLLVSVDGVWWDESAGRVSVSGVSADSRAIRPGEVFVAVRGRERDGHGYIGEAIARGAVAVVASREVGEVGVPVVRVEDTRRALAELAAGWYSRPGESLSLIGVTGTFGKTTVLAMIEAILIAAGRRVGVIGSDAVGIRLRGRPYQESELTTPDAVTLHGLLAAMRDRGVEVAGIEVTSQALEQRRVHALRFDLGVFTNLKLLEHMEYHGSFDRYVAAKATFFRHVRQGAPLIYAGDDEMLRELVKPLPLALVGCGCGDAAAIRIGDPSLDATGTTFRVDIRQPLRRLDGGEVAPVQFDLRLGLLGWPAVANAVLAGATALTLGVDLPTVQRAVGELPPVWRRREILYRERFTILDDTAAHPETFNAVFDVAARLPHRRLHIVYAIRGRRGAELNRRDAQSLALWAASVPITTLVVTSSIGAVEDKDTVEAEERQAFLEELDRDRLRSEYCERIDAAVTRTLDAAGDGDLVLLLGAHGMDRGRDVARAWLEQRGEEAGF